MGGSNLDLSFWERRRIAWKQWQKSKKIGSEIFILKTPEAHISTNMALIASKIIAINFYAQFTSKKNLLSFFWRLLPPWTTDHQDHHQNQCRHNEQDHDWVDTGLGLLTSWRRGWTVANQEFVAVGNNYFYAVLCMTKSHRCWKLHCQKSIQEKVIYDSKFKSAFC